jgi:hypothetical protein
MTSWRGATTMSETEPGGASRRGMSCIIVEKGTKILLLSGPL